MTKKVGNRDVGKIIRRRSAVNKPNSVAFIEPVFDVKLSQPLATLESLHELANRFNNNRYK